MERGKSKRQVHLSKGQGERVKGKEVGGVQGPRTKGQGARAKSLKAEGPGARGME